MASGEITGLHQFTVPDTPEQLFDFKLSQMPDDASVQDVVNVARSGDSVATAVEALVQAGVLMDLTDEQDGSDTDIDPASLEKAGLRKDFALRVLTVAKGVLDKKFSKEREATGANIAKVIFDRDVDKLFDFMEQTDEDFEDHPLLEFMYDARAKAEGQAIAVVNDADIMIRLVMTGEVQQVQVVPDSSGEDSTEETSESEVVEIHADASSQDHPNGDRMLA